MPMTDECASGAAVEKSTGDPAPHNVEALHDVLGLRSGALANHRRAAVAGNHEIAVELTRAGDSVSADANDAIFFEYEIAHSRTALEYEMGKTRCLGDD